MTVLIFANGDLQETGWIRPFLKQARHVVAANGGSRHLWRLNHPPDVVIGDVDSLADDIRLWLEANGTALSRHPIEKDYTDLELALLYVVERYDDDVLIFGAFGGRLDQMLANILLLVHPALADRRVELLTMHERAWLVTGSTEIHGQPGDTVSLVPLGGDVYIRSTTGLRWALHEEVLAFGPARGVSNKMVAHLATVTVGQGSLLCVHTDGAWQR